MEIKEKITLDMLTKDSVSILKQKFIIIDNEEIQVGENIRNAYMNQKDDREYLKQQLSEEYLNAIFAIWDN